MNKINLLEYKSKVSHVFFFMLILSVSKAYYKNWCDSESALEHSRHYMDQSLFYHCID